jgi:thioredoxin-related protein
VNLIAGWPPPQDREWSENLYAFGGSTAQPIQLPADPNSHVPQPSIACPKGINSCFHNYYEAMAYARSVKKPVLLDFTGNTCLNCRKTEQGIWPQPEVLSQINNDYVLVSLYVDERAKLPLDSQYVSKYSKDRIETTGEKWHEMEIYRFRENSLPYYILLDNEGIELNKPIGYTSDVTKYAEFLQEGKREFVKRTKK